MAVQAGIWNFKDGPADQCLLKQISTQLAEYGPDGEMIECVGSLALLYRPFNTTEESRVERQPYAMAEGEFLIWDGRLDNGDELIPQLKDLLHGDESDVSVVAAVFRRWGASGFSRLIGDWALTICDLSHREIILARDYAGIRHLFYYQSQHRLLWCSHLAGLALCGDTFTLCNEYIVGYVGLWPSARLTPYSEIRAVEPGTYVRLCAGSIATHPYWTFDPSVKNVYKTDKDYEEHFRYLFQQSIRRRLRANSPILAELSGGLDSSSVVCMADRTLTPRQSLVVDTFSYCVRDEPEENDVIHFTKIEELRGRVGHHVEMRDISAVSPFVSPGFSPAPVWAPRPELTDARNKIIKEGKYRVVLSGIGGDEMLGQALDPRVQIADLLRQFQLHLLGKQLITWSLLLRRPLAHLLLDAIALLFPTIPPLRHPASVANWLNVEVPHAQQVSTSVPASAAGSWRWLPSARDSFQTLNVLHRQLSQMPARCWETRYPYLDRDLVEFLVPIPTDQLLRPADRRSLMRRAFADLLPQEILSRQTKSRAGRYFALALQRHWPDVEQILRSSCLAQLGFIKHDEFRAALLEVKSGRVPPDCLQLFKTLAAECWLTSMAERKIIDLQIADNLESLAEQPAA